jgi:hypothetical protein
MALSAGGGAAAAQSNVSNTSPYYNNTTDEIDNETWMEGREEPTLTNVSAWVTRVSTFVIGSGGAGGGVGAAGALLTGALVFALVIAMVGATEVGVVGGAVAGISGVFLLVELGLAPSWLYVVVLGALGIVATAVFLRVVR